MKIFCFREAGRITAGWLAEDGKSLRRAREQPEFSGCLDEKAVLDGLLGMEPSARRNLAAREGPAAALGAVEILPPNPWAPVVWANHGNAPMVWKFQEPRARRWQLPRLPYLRVRPWNSLAGPEETVRLPQGTRFVHGAELAVVIGRPARCVSEDDAAAHIAGFTLLNDGFVAGLFDDDGTPDPVGKQSRDTISKAADRVTGLGPCIVCDEDFPDPYDCLVESRCHGRLQKRGWSGSYLLTAEYLIWTLSRSSALPTGSVISLGACGWDGCRTDLDEAPGAETVLEVKADRIGALRSRLRRAGHEEGPPLCGPPEYWRSEVVSSAHRSRSVWLQRPVDGDGANPPPRPILYPAGVEAPLGQTLTLPASAGRIEVVLRAVLRIAQPVSRWCPGRPLPGTVHLGLSVRDAGFADAVSHPTPYEERGAWFLGGCADGFLQVSDWAAEDAGPFRLEACRAAAEGTYCIEAGCFDKHLEMLGRMATLLPGDLVALGGWHPPLALPPGAELNWRCGTRTGSVSVIDSRQSGLRDPEIR